MKKFLLLGAGALLSMSANATISGLTYDPEPGASTTTWPTNITITITDFDQEQAETQDDYTYIEVNSEIINGDWDAYLEDTASVMYDSQTYKAQIRVMYATKYDEETEETTNLGIYGLEIEWPAAVADNYDYGTGIYEITLPADLFSYNNNNNEATTWTITYSGSWGKDVVTPPYGADYIYNANDLSDIVVGFEKYYSFSSVNEGYNITYELKGDDDGGIMMMAEEGPQDLPEDLYNVDAANGKIFIDLSSFGEGTWIITIPAGLVNFDEYTVNNELTLTYVIFNGLSYATVLSPEYESVVMPGNVELTWDYQTVYATEAGLSATLKYYVESDDPDAWWPEEKTVDVPLSAFAFATLSDEEGGVDNGPGDVPVPEAEEGAASGNVLIVKVADLLDGVTGNVTLVIPEGIVENEDGLVNPEQSVSFKITPAFEGADDYELTYNEETNALDLTWGEGLWLSINRSAQEAYFLVNEELKIETSIYDSFDNPTGDVSLNDTNDTVSFSLNNLTVDGNYTLVIPEAYILIEDNNVMSASLEITYEFNLDAGVFSDGHTVGVSSLNSEFVAPTGVYNLQGVKVGDSVEGLAKGLYIVNGKKVLVK